MTPSILLTPTDLESAIVRDPLLVSPDTTVMQAIACMSDVRIGRTDNTTESIDNLHQEARSSCVLVMEGEQVLGILTERDVVRLSAQQRSLDTVTMREVMASPAVTLQEADLTDLSSALNLLQQHQIRHLPLIGDRGQGVTVTGLITSESLQQCLRPADVTSSQREPRSEATLQEREVRFQTMATNVPGAIFRYLLRPDGSDAILYRSPGYYDLWEVAASGVESTPALWQMSHAADLPALHKSLMESAQTLQPWSCTWRITTPSGQQKWLEVSGRPERQANGDVIWDSLLLDVSDRQLAQQALEFQVEFDRLVAHISNRFVQLRPGELTGGIQHALQHMGEFLQLDTTYIFRYSQDHQAASMTHEWMSAGLPTQIDNLQNVSCAAFPWATATLLGGDILCIPSLDQLPPEAAVDRQNYAQVGVQASLCIPLRDRHRVVGFVGFVSFHRPHVWSEDIIRILQIFSEILTYTVQRQQAEESLRHSYQQYNDLVNRIPVGVYKFCMKPNGDVQFEYISPRWGEMNQLDPAAVMHDSSLAFGLLHPDELDEFERLNQQARTTLTHFIWEGRMVIDGEVRWVHIESSPTVRENGDIVWDGIQYDITTLIQAKQEQERSLAKAIAARTEATKARDLLTSVFERMNDGIVALDTEWRYTYINDNAGVMLGRSAADLIGKHIWTEFPDGIGKPFYNAYYRAVEQQTVIYLEDYYEPWKRWFENRIYPDANGLTIYFTEITDRKLGEIAVRQSEQRYASLAAAAPVGIFRTDADGNCLYVNDRWSQIAGLSLTDALGMGWMAGLHPDDREQIASEWHCATHENRPFKLEYRFQRPDGSVSWVFGQAVAERNADGLVTGYVGTITDISDRKQAEAALIQSEAQSRAILAAIPDYMFRVGADGIYREVVNSKRAIDLVPATLNPVGLAMVDVLPAAIATRHLHHLEQALNTGELQVYEQHVQITADHLRFEEIRVIKSGEDDVLFMIRDISDRKLAELRLALQNSILERIAKADPLPDILDALVQATEEQLEGGICSVLLCDLAGKMHYGAAPHLPAAYNQAIEGASIGEGAGSCGTAAFRRETVIVADIATDPLWQSYRSLALEYGLRACWSVPVIAGDGSVLATFAVYHREIHHPQQRELDVIALVANITKIAIEREQARQALEQLNRELEAKVIERTAALQEREAQLRDLFDNATDLIQSVAPDGRIVFVNQAWKTALGYEDADLEQLSIFQVIHPDEHEHCQFILQQLFEGINCEGIETRFLTKAGREIILEGNANCRFQDGQAIATRGIFRDITARKQTEVKLLQTTAQLEASNQELEQFAYVASHDLQEPLRSITSYTQLLAKRYQGQIDEKADKYIYYIVDGAARMQQLIQDLLTYSRVGRYELKQQPTDCSAVLQQVKQDLRVAIAESHAVITVDPLPTLLADTAQVTQVFQNLLGNALKYRGQESPIIRVSAKRQGSEWVFSIQDNGIGIEPQYAERIFEMFQRLHTRREYEGTGLGLAICKKIVERHHGRLWVESQLGQGATFFFTLPALSND